MAKMHSRAKGKSRSKRPETPTKKSWARLDTKELEMLIVKLAKQGNTASQIGTILRDQYGVPLTKTILGKRMTKVLAEHKLTGELPEDLSALIKKAALLKKHLEKMRKDNTAKRGIQLTESKIKRLSKYYKRVGKLPVTWRFTEDMLKSA